MRLGLALSLTLLAGASAGAAEAPLRSGDIADARAILDVRPAPRPGFVPEALPPRFVLFEDGRVVVGGHASLATARLDREAHKALEKRLAQVKRLPGLGASVSFGAELPRYRLRLPKERIDLVASGDPRQAPPEFGPLAALIRDLEAFDHAGLQPLVPEQVWASAREEELPGGCRLWRRSPSVSELATQARPLPAADAAGWPTGAYAASVCEGQRRFTLTLRPLVPGELP
jgi:hypothetical protein